VIPEGPGVPAGDGLPSPAPRARATGRRMGGNLVMTAFSFGWSAVLLVVSVPILVHGLGISAYGVFALASLLLGYAALLDLGLTPALVRAIAVYALNPEPGPLSRVLGTAFTLFLLLGVMSGLLLILVAPFAVTTFLHLPPGLRADARFVIDLAAVGFAANLALTLFTAVPQGLQRLDVYAGRTILLSTLSAAAQIGAVKLGLGLRGVAVGTLAVNLLGLILFVVVARRLLPGVAVRPRFNRWALRQLIGFGALKFVSQLSGLITFQLDRIIVAAFLPIAQVTYYAVPVTITQKLTLIQASFSTAFFPAASEMHAVRDRARLRQLYLGAQKLMLTITMPLVVLIAVLSRSLLSAWLGPRFGAASGTILAVLALGYGLTLLTGMPALIADATGHPHWTATAGAVSAAINVTLTLLFVPRFGAIGAAYALLINSGLQGLAFILVVQRFLLRVGIMEVFRSVVLRPAAVAVVVFVYAWVAAGLVTTLLELLAALALGALIALGSTLAFGVLTDDERRVVRGVLDAGLARVRRFSQPAR
jgi:O-antigen/teichoic acid export membrane protein